MRCLPLWGLCLLLLTGCSDGPPPTPVDPVPAGVVVPTGMPNDVWFQDNVLKSDVPVLVDFTAPWCPPCQMMKPFVHKIGETYSGRLKVVEVDVDEHPYLADHFQVTGIPRLMVIKGGKIAADEVGGRSYDEIVALVKPTVGEP